MRETLTIGRLAKAAGVNVETVRYYQRRGLLAEPRKPPGGHRVYPADAVRQLGFIRRAQELGFSLEEVKRLQKLPPTSCREAREIAEEKRRVLEARLAQLQQTIGSLGEFIALCGRNKPRTPCPFLEMLAEGSGRG